jgi:hypothetical protein
VPYSIHHSLGWLGTAALALASIPAVAEPAKVAQGKAAELGVMSVSLKDAVKLNYGLQGQLQGAGTPNEAGIGGFVLPYSSRSHAMEEFFVVVYREITEYFDSIG